MITGELRQPGLYFLFGFEDEPRVYIGKSIDCMMRLKQHNGDPKKEFWNIAVAFITKDNSFTRHPEWTTEQGVANPFPHQCYGERRGPRARIQG